MNGNGVRMKPPAQSNAPNFTSSRNRACDKAVTFIRRLRTLLQAFVANVRLTHDMQVLIASAFLLACAVPLLRLYLNKYLPDASPDSNRSLQRGLRIGTLSAIGLLLLYIVTYFRPAALGRNAPYVLCALVGNVANLAALVFCLRELNGESLFAALLLVLEQLLWILYAVTAVLVDF
jgi:hypothetical protein